MLDKYNSIIVLMFYLFQKNFSNFSPAARLFYFNIITTEFLILVYMYVLAENFIMDDRKNYETTNNKTTNNIAGAVAQ